MRFKLLLASLLLVFFASANSSLDLQVKSSYDSFFSKATRQNVTYTFVTLPAGKTAGFQAKSYTVYEAPAAGTILTSPIVFGKGVTNVYISGLKGPNTYGISFSLPSGVDAFDDGGGGSANIFICGIEANSAVDNCLMRRSTNSATWDGTLGSTLWNGLYFQHVRIEGAFRLFYGTWSDGKDYVVGLTCNDFWWGNNAGQNPVLLEAHNVFAATFMNWVVRNQANPLGDCGTIWIEVGNAKFENWDWEGTWGYIFRLGGIILPGLSLDQSSHAVNCKKAKSVHFGLGSYRVDDFANTRTHIGKNGMTSGPFTFQNCTVADTYGQGYYAGLSVDGDTRDQTGAAGTINIYKCYAANVYVENQWKLALYSDDAGGNTKYNVDGLSVPQPSKVPQAPYTYYTTFTAGLIPATDKIGADYYPLAGSPLLTSGIGARAFTAPALPTLPANPGGGTTTPPVTTPPVTTPPAKTVVGVKSITTTTTQYIVSYSDSTKQTF